jgi:glucose/mannose-6-phosphate isomerase
MMNTLIEQFPAQLKKALEIGASAEINQHEFEINKIYIAGMGGSAIGGDFVSQFVEEECKVPVITSKKYNLPSCIDQHTLVITSSYSGNTEETVAVFKSCIHTGAKMVVISSGGRLQELAQENKVDFIQLPAGSPSPRSCLGYSVVTQLYVLIHLNLISSNVVDDIKAASELLKFDQDDVKEKAKKVAQAFYKKTPVIYTDARMEAVALRYKQQICENAKQLCWYHVFPEMNHNELVGWKDQRNDLAILFLRNRDDLRRNAVRMDICIEIISGLCDTVLEVYSKGQSLIEKTFYFVHLGDWISWYLSQLRGVDAIEIDVIDFLKKELSQI